MLLRFAAIALSALLMACQSDDSNSLINTGPGGGGGGGGGNKPTQTLHPHALLMAAGLAELHQLVKAVTSNSSDCAKLTGATLEWKCDWGPGAVARKGTATVTTDAEGITLRTPRLGLYNFVRIGGRAHRELQEFALTLAAAGQSTYRFRFKSSSAVGNAQRGRLSYHFEWDFSGTISVHGGAATVTDADGTLTVLKAGGGSTDFVFETNTAGPLAIETCGNFSGTLNFSGYKQSAVKLVADAAKGLKAESGGKALPWPACDAPEALYGLKIASRYWAKPQP